MTKSKNKTKSKRQTKENSTATRELHTFSLAAAISEATATAESSPAPTTPQPAPTLRKIFPTNKSSQSIATNTSFVTANESLRFTESTQDTTKTDASYLVDSSDEESNEELNFGNDPLAVLSQTATSDTTPTEISFNTNPEETIPTTTSTMTSKKSTKIKVSSNMEPVAASTQHAVDPTPTPTTTTTPKEDPPVTTTITKTIEINDDEESAHFDVAQNVYGTVKNVWAWGKTVPVITNLLDLTEKVASKVVETTVHMDLPAIDQKTVTPQLKKLDDSLVTPVILAVWKFIEPAVVKGDEMVVQPVMKEVVPRVLAPLSMFHDDKKKKLEEKERKVEEEKTMMIDSSPTPEVVPALN